MRCVVSCGSTSFPWLVSSHPPPSNLMSSGNSVRVSASSSSSETTGREITQRDKTVTESHHSGSLHQPRLIISWPQYTRGPRLELDREYTPQGLSGGNSAVKSNNNSREHRPRVEWDRSHEGRKPRQKRWTEKPQRKRTKRGFKEITRLDCQFSLIMAS